MIADDNTVSKDLQVDYSSEVFEEVHQSFFKTFIDAGVVNVLDVNLVGLEVAGAPAISHNYFLLI